MILVEIEEIIKFKPIKWISEGLSGLKASQTYVRFPGDHPANPEYGSVVLSVKVLQGKFKEITQLLVIGDNAEQGRLVDLKMINTGNYRIEVEFDTIFGHGLEYSTAAFLQKGGALLALRKPKGIPWKPLTARKNCSPCFLYTSSPPEAGTSLNSQSRVSFVFQTKIQKRLIPTLWEDLLIALMKSVTTMGNH